MEEKIKRKVDVTIAGMSMSLITDETDSFVDAVTRRMDAHMSSLLSNRNCSQLDAAMLTAIAFCGDKITAEKKLRNLEAQVSLYDVSIRRLKDEIASLKKERAATEPEEEKSDETVDDDADGQMSIEEHTPEKKISKPELSRQQKLREIEALLKKN